MTFAPSFKSPQRFDRAVRLWAMSPTSPTVTPVRSPSRSRIEKMSSSPWVGCSCGPSPALITPTLRCCASRCGVPGVLCRTTTASIPIASRLRAVSMNDSPLERLLVEAEKSTTSAPSRRAASEKLVRVRVEFSKNRFTTVEPVSTESLRRQWSVASLKRAAVSSSSRISSPVSRSRSSRWRCCQPAGTWSGWNGGGVMGELGCLVAVYGSLWSAGRRAECSSLERFLPLRAGRGGARVSPRGWSCPVKIKKITLPPGARPAHAGCGRCSLRIRSAGSDVGSDERSHENHPCLAREHLVAVGRPGVHVGSLRLHLGDQFGLPPRDLARCRGACLRIACRCQGQRQGNGVRRERRGRCRGDCRPACRRRCECSPRRRRMVSRHARRGGRRGSTPSREVGRAERCRPRHADRNAEEHAAAGLAGGRGRVHRRLGGCPDRQRSGSVGCRRGDRRVSQRGRCRTGCPHAAGRVAADCCHGARTVPGTACTRPACVCRAKRLLRLASAGLGRRRPLRDGPVPAGAGSDRLFRTRPIDVARVGRRAHNPDRHGAQTRRRQRSPGA